MNKPKHTVINERLIRDCIRLQLSSTEEDRKGRDRDTSKPKQHLAFHEVERLEFSFKSISQIDNLVGFDRLTRLQLDNNDISKIENLSHLVSLKWLDLSFNQIERIEGLEALTQLEDLSLRSNKIEVLEGMDTLTKLQSFVVGYNQLNDVETVARYLRKFQRLQLLALEGNPCCKHPTYEDKILAHVRDLKYLDFRLVDKAKVEKARADQQEQLQELKQEDEKQVKEAEEKTMKDAEEAKLSKANLAGMNSLWEDMMREDPEAKIMNGFMEVESALRDAAEKYRTRFTEVVDEFKTKMQEHRAKKDAEILEFQGVINGEKKRVDAACTQLINDFQRRRKRMQESAQRTDDEGIDDADLQKMRSDVDNLKTTLLEWETDQVEAYQEVIKMFELQYTELTDQTIETITQSFTKLREEEKTYFDEIFEIFNKMVEARHSQQQESGLAGDVSFVDDGSKQVLSMLDNKEDINKLMNESHEAHEQKMYAKEEQLISNEKRELEELAQKNVSDEHARNRMRVAELNAHCELILQEINSITEQYE